MFQVFMQNESGRVEVPFMYFESSSLVDAVQVCLNLHRGCNCKHRIYVYDVDSSMSLISLYSENYD